MNPSSATAARPPAHRRRRRWVIALGVVLAVLAGFTAWTNLRPYTLRASVVINASPQRVWQIISDLPDYRGWNPFIVSARGRLQVGAMLNNQLRDATGITTFMPVVLAVRPDHEVRWIGKVGPGGVFDGEHSLLIEQIAPGRVRFTQQERFTGVAVPFYEHHLQAYTLPQFRAMNAALATRAEQQP